jgi:hypothetical protein
MYHGTDHHHTHTLTPPPAPLHRQMRRPTAKAQCEAAAKAQSEEAAEAAMDVTDRLNAQAVRLAARRGPELKPGDEDYGCVAMVNAGRTVFKKRWWPVMYLYWAYTAYGLLTAPSLPFLLVRRCAAATDWSMGTCRPVGWAVVVSFESVVDGVESIRDPSRAILMI